MMSDTETQPNDPLPEPPSSSISFQVIFSELQTFQAENNGSLSIPTTHPSMAKILDSLTSNCIEYFIEKRWDDQMEALTKYKQDEGNITVSATHPDLGSWVADQKEYFVGYEERRVNPLTRKRYERLKAVGFGNAVTKVNRWDVRYEELRKYREENGHCDVPIDHPGLGIWVLLQRYNFNEMPQQRIDALDNLDFIWNQSRLTNPNKDDKWNAKFEDLMKFLQEYGHTNVPTTYGPLGHWVAKQHQQYNQLILRKPSSLSRYRIEKLEDIGFQWRINKNPSKTIPWDERFEQLIKYKEENGHCRIPRDHPYFGNWPSYQKAEYSKYLQGKDTKLDQPRINKLVSIGFFEDNVRWRSGDYNKGKKTKKKKL